MELNISKYSDEPKWIPDMDNKNRDENGAWLKIRPYPAELSVMIVQASGGIRIEGKDRKEQYMYCLLDWKGYTDDGKEYPCTEANKETVFKYDIGGIPQQVIVANINFHAEKEESEKN